MVVSLTGLANARSRVCSGAILIFPIAIMCSQQ
jgi:hypothetical protein